MIKIVVVSLALTTACAFAQKKSIAASLGKGDEIKSPDGKTTCFVDYSARDWNEVKIRFSDGKVQTIWKSVRSVGVSWSPHSEYLAVEDYLDRIATAVLVFRLNGAKETADLIYQTPYSNSVFVQYRALSWVGGEHAIEIGESDPHAHNISKEVVSLIDRKPISETIYCGQKNNRDSGE